MSNDSSLDHAVQAGSDILQRFRSAKAKDASFGLSSKSFTNDDNSVSVGYYDAIADGSNLGLAYSASKRRDHNASSVNSAFDLFMSTPAERDPSKSAYVVESESIDLLRNALARLAFLQQSDKENIPRDISDIVIMLQGVEEQLETMAINGNHQKSIFNISPTQSPRVKTPLADRTARSGEKGPRSLLKVYMDNQLDLNEEEMQQYEDMINDLAEKLELMTDERDEQVAASSALGEKLQNVLAENSAFATAQSGWEQEKASLLKSMLDAEVQSKENERVAAADLQRSEASVQELIQKESSYHESMQLLQRQLVENNVRCEGLSERLVAAEAELNSAMQQSNLLAEEKTRIDIELSAAVCKIAQLETAHEQSIAMHNATKEGLLSAQESADAWMSEHHSVVAALKAEVSAQEEIVSEKMDEIADLNEQLRNAVNASQQYAQNDADRLELEKEVQALVSDVDALNSQLLERDDLIQRLELAVESESAQVRTLSEQLSIVSVQAEKIKSELQTSLIARAQSDELVAEMKRAVEESKIVKAETPAATRRMSSGAISTPNVSAVDGTPVRAPRSLLKVYMDNQLDLNEEEMQQYEDMINDLAEKLECAERERDDALSIVQSSDDARVEAEQLIESLKYQLSNKDAAQQQIGEVVSGLQHELKGTRNSVQQLQVEKDHLMSRLIEAQITADAKLEEFNSLLGLKTQELEMKEQSLIEIKVQLDQTKQNSYYQQNAPPVYGNDASFSASGLNVSAAIPNVADSDAAIKQKDEQIRMQISQLENFQDMLSDQQRANALLKEQRNQLKAIVDTMKKTESELLENAAALRGRDEWMSSRIVQLEASLRNEAEARIENAVSLEEAHAALQASQDALSVTHQGISISPLKTPDRNVSGFALGAMTPGRLSRLETRVRELTAELNIAEQRRNEIQLDHDRLLVRLQCQSQHMDELVRETEVLKADVDTRLSGIDDMKARGLCNDATMNAALLEKDAVIAHLKQSLSSTENALSDTQMVLRDKTSDLDNQRSIVAELQQLLESLKEKDAVTDVILEEFASEREDLEAQIEGLSNDLQAQCDLAQELQDKIDEGIDMNQNSSKEEEYANKCSALEEELNMVRLQLQSMHGDLTSNASILSNRLNELLSEKQEAEALIRKQKQILLQKENEIYTKSNAVDTLSRSVQSTAQMMTFYHSQMINQSEAFERRVSDWMYNSESRVACATNKLALAVHSLPALQKSDHDSAPLWTHMHETMAGVGMGGVDSRSDAYAVNNQAIQALQMQLQNESQSNAQVFERLTERLEDAERRALEASTGGARAQASAMRAHAYLDGECIRLRNLTDHLRLINAKLIEDMKLVRADSAQVKSLEHRLSASHLEAAQLNQALAAAEQTYSGSMMQMQAHAELARDNSDREISQLQRSLQAAQSQMVQMQQRLDAIQESSSNSSASASQEHAELSQKISWLEGQVQHHAALAQSHEVHARTLENTASQSAEQVLNLQQVIDALRSEQQAMLVDWQRKAEEMVRDRDEAMRKSAELQQTLVSARASLQAAEDALFEKEAAQAASAAKLADYADESRKLRSQCDLLQEQLASSVGHSEDRETYLREAQREVEIVRGQYDEFKAKTHRQALMRVSEVESALGHVQEELQNSQSTITSTMRDCQYYKDALAHAETKFSTAQTELISQCAKDAAMQERLSSLTQESDYYRAQWEDAMTAQQMQSREVASMRSTVQDKVDHIETYEARIKQLEKDLVHARTKLQSMNSFDEDMGADIREIADLVSYSFHPDAHDLFASPVGSSTVSEKDSLLPKSSHAMASLRSKLCSFNVHHENLVAQLDTRQLEFYSLKDALAQSENQVRITESAKEELEYQVQALEIQLAGSKDKISVASTERDKLLSLSAEQANKTRALLHDLNSTLSDVVERAAAAVSHSGSTLTYSLAQTIPESSWQLVLPTQAMTSDFSTSALLATVCHETERILAALCSSLESSIAESVAKKFAEEQADALLVEKEKSVESSYDASFYSAMQHGQGPSNNPANPSNLQRAEREIYQLRITLSEMNRHKLELENEMRQAGEINGDLRLALNEAEGLCGDLRGHVRSIQNDRDRLEDDLATMQAALEQQRRRCHDSELALERHTTDMNRLRGENTSLEALRRTLESELDRRAVAPVPTHGGGNSGLSAHSQDAERLVLAVSHAMDVFMSLPSPPPLPRDIISPKVDSCEKMLAALSAWARDDARSRRALSDKIGFLEGELTAARAESEERLGEVRKKNVAVADAVAELKSKRSEISSLGSDNSRLTLECDKAKREAQTVQSLFEDEKRSKQRMQQELVVLTQESTKFRMESETQRSVITKLQSSMNQSKERVVELETEVEHRTEQLRASKATCVKLTLAIEQLERSEAKERRDRDAVETKKGEADITKVALARLQSRYSELEISYKSSKETVASLRETASNIEKQLAENANELEASKRKLHSSESRCEYAIKESRNLEANIAALRNELQSARDKASEEFASRLRVESAMELLKGAHHGEDENGRESRNARTSKNSAALQAALQIAEDKCKALEYDKSALSAKLKSARASLEETQSAFVSEQNKTKTIEGIEAKHAAKLDALQRELSSSRELSHSMRQEGRKARSAVLEAVAQMREVVNIIRADASAAGTILSTPEKTRGGAHDKDDMTEKQSLLEALSVSELTAALSALRDSIIYLRQGQKHSAGLQSTIKTLEREKAALKGEMDIATQRHESTQKTLNDQISALQKRLAEVIASAKSETSGGSSSNINDLALKKERTEKEKILKELEASRATLAANKVEMDSIRSAKDSKECSRELLQALEGENAQLKQQKSAAVADLQAAVHHKKVLSSTIERLEKQLKSSSDALSDAQHKIKHASNRASLQEKDSKDAPSAGDRDELDGLKRSVSRYRARAAAYDEVIAAYRQGLFALYPSAGTYGAAQYGQLNSSKGQGEWFEREIALVQRTYEAEMRVLESEVVDLWGRLRQSHSFSSELSRRFEETLQQQFRSVKSSTAEGLSRQVDFLAANHKRADVQLNETMTTLQQEREASRQRLAQLVDQLKMSFKIPIAEDKHMGHGEQGLFASPSAERHSSGYDTHVTSAAGSTSMDNAYSALTQPARGSTSTTYRIQPVNPVTTTSAHGGSDRAGGLVGASFRVRRATGAAASFPISSGAPPSPAAYRSSAGHLSDLANLLKSPR